MWIERTISSELPRMAAAFPVVLLTGPRSVGKTSLMGLTFPGYRYLSLDDGQNAEAAESRPQQLLEAFPPPLLVDEVRHAPALFRYLKAYVDRHRNEPGLFVITGSQGFPLMQAASESLAGRVAVVPFLGLSAEEWLSCPEASGQHDRQEFLWRGSYPGLWAEPEVQPGRDRWYQGYVATYLERDVRALLNVARLRDFERFLRACAIRIGQLLNMSELGRDVGISPTAARSGRTTPSASGSAGATGGHLRLVCGSGRTNPRTRWTSW